MRTNNQMLLALVNAFAKKPVQRTHVINKQPKRCAPSAPQVAGPQGTFKGVPVESRKPGEVHVVRYS